MRTPLNVVLFPTVVHSMVFHTASDMGEQSADELAGDGDIRHVQVSFFCDDKTLVAFLCNSSTV